LENSTTGSTPRSEHLYALVAPTLQSLHSEGIDSGKVEVRAMLMSTDRQNAMLEGVVQRLSLEPGISDVSWEVAASENE
jgi:uncharacterized membrane protein YhiD involved in acid resistance